MSDTSLGNASPHEGSRRFLTWVLIFTVVGLLLRMMRLGHQSIWIDEGLSIGWIHEIEKRGWGSLIQNIHGPLHAISIYLSSRISMSEWWLRLPSMLAGSLSIPALAFLGRRLWNERVGLTAAAYMMLSPFALYYSQECRNYAFSFLFSCLAAGAAWGLARSPGLRTAARFVVAELLGVFSNLNGIFLALGLNGWLLYALRGNRRGLGVWLGVHAVVVLMFVPYALQINRQVRPERMIGVETDFGEKEPLRGETTLHPLALPYAVYAFSAGYSLGATLEELRLSPASAVRSENLPGMFLVGIGFALPFLLGILRRDQAPASGMLLSAMVVVAGMTLWLAATNMKPFNVRYLSVLLPFFFLFVARGLWRFGVRWRFVIAGVATLVSLWSSFNYHFVPRYGRDDTKGVVEFLRERAGPQDLILHISLDMPLNYYNRLSQPIIWASSRAAQSAETARSYVQELVQGGAPVLWYLECRPEGPDPERHLLRAMQAIAKGSVVYPFPGIQVHRFDLVR